MHTAVHSTVIVVVLAVVGSIGCAPSASGRMIAVDPPPEWEERVERDRQAKDLAFKEDPETPILAEDLDSFEDLEYWPPTPSLRFVGSIHFYDRAERFEVVTTAGKRRPCERLGWLSFVYDRQVCVLQIYRLLDSDPTDETGSLFVPFTDTTTGNETYPAGRYVNLERTADDRYVLDFNRAYNPYCAYGAPERFACPVTPAANRLPVRIESGEHGFKGAGGER